MENKLKNFLDTFSSSISEENKKLYSDLIDKFPKIEELQNPSDFHFSVIYPWENFLSAYLSSFIKNKDIIFIYENYNYIENHFSKLFNNVEGSACSVDKANTIIRELIKHFNTGSEIVFDYNQEYTFHLPKVIFTEHEEILNFYKSLKSLLYGNYNLYIPALGEILKKAVKKDN